MTFQLAGNRPKIYEKVMVPLWFGRWAEALVDKVSLGTSERVLDVACGTGVTTRLVKSKVGPSGKVVELDINAPMLAKAKDLVASADATIRRAADRDPELSGIGLLASQERCRSSDSLVA